MERISQLQRHLLLHWQIVFLPLLHLSGSVLNLKHSIFAAKVVNRTAYS